MEGLSNKALITLELLKRLKAFDKESKTNIYAILNLLDSTELSDILPEEEEYELECIKCEMTQKSVSTTLASLVRKGLVVKTAVDTTKIKNEVKSIMGYYLTNK